MLLTLPTLSPAVPTTLEVGRAGEAHLRLVLAMLKSGMIPASAIAGLPQAALSSAALRSLVESCWTDFATEMVQFRHLSCGVTLYLGEAPKQPWEKQEAAIHFNAPPPKWFYVGERMMALERLSPGLGRKVMLSIHRTLSLFSYLPFTTFGAFEMASYIYWYGGECEEEAVDELIGMGEEPESIEDMDIVSCNELFGHMPQWAYKHFIPKSGSGEEVVWDAPLSDVEFQQAVEQQAGTAAYRLLKTASALDALLSTDIQITDRPEADIDEGFAVIAWSDLNPCPQLRVFDDYANELLNGGGETADSLGKIELNLEEAEGLSNALTRFRNTLSVLRALDDTLDALEEFQP